MQSSLLAFWNFIWPIKYTKQINQNIHYACRENIKVYNKEVRSIGVFKNWKHKVILRFMTALGFECSAVINSEDRTELCLLSA